MPLYSFELFGPAGEPVRQIELPLSTANRDDSVAIRALLPAGCEGLTFRRLQVPSSLAIVGSARNPGETANQVLDAYKRIEQRLGNTSEFQRRIGHSPDQVKRAWGEQ